MRNSQFTKRKLVFSLGFVLNSLTRFMGVRGQVALPKLAYDHLFDPKHIGIHYGFL